MKDLYFDKVMIMTPSGDMLTLESWQQKYSLQPGSQQIGRFFKYTEHKIRQNIEDYGKVVVCEPLIRLLDRFRELHNAPVTITSFNRSKEKQERLQEEGFKAARVSPHVHFMAADIDASDLKDMQRKSHLLQIAAEHVDVIARVGWKQYWDQKKQTFVHVDVCPEYFAKGKPFHDQPHPIQWETKSVW